VSTRAPGPNDVWSVPLPAGAELPIRVYVNGEERAEGTEFTVEGGRIRFDPPLKARPPLGLGRKMMLAIGIGVYGDLKGDSLDVRYTVGGEDRLATDVPLSPGGGADPPPAPGG
jgi:hypothetical protein